MLLRLEILGSKLEIVDRKVDSTNQNTQELRSMLKLMMRRWEQEGSVEPRRQRGTGDSTSHTLDEEDEEETLVVCNENARSPNAGRIQ
jgi:hypothetical protein